MKKFILEIFLFCLPIVPLFLFIFCIDPHNYFNVSKVVSNETKFTAFMRSPEAMPRGDMLWNMLKFNRQPCRNVIIGNSQGFLFREKLISELTREAYYNFSVPGVTLRTSVNTFWYIIEHIKPERVFIQISFPGSNCKDTRADNLFQSTKEYIDKPYLYFLNKDILLDSYYNLKFEIEKKRGWPGQKAQLKTINGKEDVGEYKLVNLFRNYAYPEKEIEDFNKISEYCKKNNIQLEFIFLPCYCRCEEFLKEKGLIAMRDRFNNDFKKLGKIDDYSNIDSINTKENNFSDYFHPTQNLTDSFTRLIWKAKPVSIPLKLK